MAIYVSTACLPGGVAMEERLKDYEAAGLAYVELGAGIAVAPGSLDRLAAAGARPLLVHNYFPPPPTPFVLNLASRDDDVRHQSLTLVEEALRLTARLDAPFYAVHGGFITDPTSFGTTSFVFPMPESPDEVRTANERFTAAITKAVARARQLGVGLLVENNVCPSDLRGKLLLQTADEFEALFRECSAPELGILFDTGHLNVTAHTFGFDPVEFADRVAPYVRAFHVHDNDGVADWHRPVRPDTWIIDVLRRPEFRDLPIILETKFQTAVELRRHVDWLTGVLAR